MDPESTATAPAGLLRRLAALLYDLVLVAALAFAATFAVLPIAGGEAILVSRWGSAAYIYHALLILIVFGYFGLGWTRGGQTLGMKAWRVRLATADGRPVNWAQAAVRFAIGAALAGLAVAGTWRLAAAGGWKERAIALALLAPAVLNFASILFEGSARSLQDLAGRLRVTKVS